MNYKAENVIYCAMYSAFENNYIGQKYKLDARVRFFLILRLLVPALLMFCELYYVFKFPTQLLF